MCIAKQADVDADCRRVHRLVIRRCVCLCARMNACMNPCAHVCVCVDGWPTSCATDAFFSRLPLAIPQCTTCTRFCKTEASSVRAQVLGLDSLQHGSHLEHDARSASPSHAETHVYLGPCMHAHGLQYDVI